jgi:hypothetical protein
MTTITTTLTRRIYTIDALLQTIDAFSNTCKASFTPEHDAYVLQITATRLEMNDEFLNYALDLSAQELLR